MPQKSNYESFMRYLRELTHNRRLLWTVWLRWAAAGGMAVVFSALFFAFFVSARAAQERDQKQGETGERDKDDPLAREQWFYKQRAFPRDMIPAGARDAALKQLDQMILQQQVIRGERAALEVQGPFGPPTAGNWTPIGPQPSSTGGPVGNVSGRVVALAVDPTNSDIVYAGGAFGGVWKSTDAGATWQPLTDGEFTQAAGSIAIDPNSCAPAPCKTIYVGTGEENFAIDSYYGGGLLKSFDAGATWTRLGASTFAGPFSRQFSPGGGARIGSIAVAPGNANIVLAAVQIVSTGTTSGLYCSGDAGVTWAPMGGITRAPGVDVAYANATTAYVSLGFTGTGSTLNNVYKSTNANQPCASQLWAPTNLTAAGGNRPPVLTPPLDPTITGRIAIGVSPSDPNTVYAGIQDPAASTFGHLLGFFKTTDGGTTWSQVTGVPDYCTAQCWYDNVVRVHPTDPTTVYVGGSAVSSFFSRLAISGTTATSTPMVVGANGNRLHVDQHAMAFGMNGPSGPRIYEGNDGGVWNSALPNSAASMNWNNLNATLNITQFYPSFSIHPSTPDVAFGGTQDNGTNRYSGNATWNEVTCGDGGWTIADPQVPSTVYASCQNIDLRKSVQNGLAGTFTIAADTGITLTDRVSFIPPFVMDPSSNQRLYFGTFRLYLTTNAAASWTAISGDLTNGSGTLTAIAVAPQNSQVVFTGANDGCVRVATNVDPVNFTATFSASCLNGTTLPARTVTHITADPSAASSAFITFSGFSNCTPPVGAAPCDGLGHIFRTTTAGASWSDITGNLPDTPANDLAIDPDDPTRNTLYAATDIGVFQTSDGGSTWVALNPASPGVPGLPRVTVQSLQLHNPSRILRAATHGRGVWETLLPNLANTASFRLSSLQPPTAPAGTLGASFAFNVTGVGFTVNTKVTWNSFQRATTFISTTQLQATLLDADLANPTTAQIVLTDSAQGPTRPLVFTVTGPAPTLTSISPSTLPAGSSQTTLTANGANFNAGSVVQWNSSSSTTSLTTTFVSSSQLTATIPASLLQFGGTNIVTVLSPAPGGGQSSGLVFTVVAANPPANDNFANAASVTLGSNNTFSAAVVDTSSATTEATDPTPSCAVGLNPAPVQTGRAKSVWYKWTATASGSLTADTIGSSYDTFLTAMTGSAGSFAQQACNDDINLGVIVQSRVTFNVTVGTPYFFMVTAYSGDGGKSTFNVALTPTPDFTISAAPASATATPGGSAGYTITVTSTNGFSATVTPSCTNLPAVLSCSAFNPASFVPAAAPGTTSTVTVTASASANLPGPPLPRRPFDLQPPILWFVAVLFSLAMAAVWRAGSSPRRRRQRLTAYAALGVVALVFALQLTGCGKGASSGGGGGGVPAARTYTLTFTGTSGATSHTGSATLVVQ